MFGIGFTELLLISIVGILFLGPEKLPGALVDIAKFIKSVKKTINEAKDSLEEEMKIADLKEEALGYKQQLDDATNELRNFKNIDFDDFDDFDESVDYDSDLSTDYPKKENTHYAKAPTKTKEHHPKEEALIQTESKKDTVTFKKNTDKKDS